MDDLFYKLMGNWSIAKPFLMMNSDGEIKPLKHVSAGNWNLFAIGTIQIFKIVCDYNPDDRTFKCVLYVADCIQGYTPEFEETFISPVVEQLNALYNSDSEDVNETGTVTKYFKGE